MRRYLILASALYAVCFGTCAAAVVYPSGVVRDATMHGVYPGPDAGGCCWLAPYASFTSIQPPGADTMLVDVAIPPYALGATPAHIVASIDGRSQTLCCFAAGVHTIALPVLPSARARLDTITMRASNTFVPVRRGLGSDTRTLTILLQSVAFQNTALGIRYVDGANVTSSPPALAQRWLSIALAFACGLATLLLTLRRARFAWLAVLITAPLSIAVYTGPTTLTVEKAVLLGAVIGLLCAPRRLRGFGDRSFWWIAGSLVLLVLTMGVSDLHAASMGAALRETLKVVQYLITFVVAFAAYASDGDEPLLRNVLAIEVLAVAATALVQEVTGAPQGAFVGSHEIPRIAGLLEGPNQLSAYLGLMLAIPFAYFAFRESFALERAALLVGACTLLLTTSRGGLLGFASTVAIVLAVRGFARYRTALFATAIALCALLSLGSVVGSAIWFGRFDHAVLVGSALSYNGGLGTRSELWFAAIALWKAHPVLGVGPGNFELLVGTFFPGVRTHANSQLLQALSEQGIVGLCALVLTIAAVAAAFFRETRVLGIAAFALVVGFWVHQVFDSLLLYPKVGIAYWTLIAIALAGAHTINRTAETTIAAPSGRKLTLPR